MFGILVSFWETLFSGAMLVLGRIGVSTPHENSDVPQKRGTRFLEMFISSNVVDSQGMQIDLQEFNGI